MTCPHRRGQPRYQERRRLIADVLRRLPANQGGEDSGRHACAWCAYEMGWEHAREAFAEALGIPADRLPAFLDANPLRPLPDLTALIRREGAPPG